MPKIEITELDLTTPGVVSDSTDVVYVPGFVDFDQDCLYVLNDKGERVSYSGITPRVPKLFTRVEDFTSLCGEHPLKFDENVNSYGDLQRQFSAKSYMTGQSGDAVLFTEDPGYVYAKELLSAGLPVMFECVNEIQEDGSTVITKFVKLFSRSDDFIYDFEVWESTVSPKIGVEIAADNIYTADGNPYTLTYPYEGISNAKSYGLLFPYDPDGEWETGSVSWDWDDDFNCPIRYRVERRFGNRTLMKDPSGEYVLYTAASEPDPSKWESDWNKYVVLTYDPELDSHGVTLFDSKYSIPSKDIYMKFTVAVNSPAYMYTALEEIFSVDNIEGIIDKGNYSVKYLTSGGYPTFEYDNNNLCNRMMNFAEKRGDCVALIDHTYYPTRTLNPVKQESVYYEVNNSSFANGDFGAMFTPWAVYSRTTTDKSDDDSFTSETSFTAPASFAYLTSLADSIKTNANWLAVAGATRGKVLNLSSGGMLTLIPNGVADAVQPRSNGVAINAITNISPYGHTIWGNRTLKKNEHNLVATSFLNIRNLVSDVKKTCYRTARGLTFEQDSDVLWINFKAEISKLLDRMKSGYGISGYKIVRDTAHEKAAEKATLCAKVILYPTYAVEDFYITIVLKDDEVTVE